MSVLLLPRSDSASTQLLETGDIVHLALWSPLLHVTRCGMSFDPNEVSRVKNPVSCMTCLVRTDVFVIPQDDGPLINPFNEWVWFKQVFGPPYNHITECCYAEDPCDWHKLKF